MAQMSFALILFVAGGLWYAERNMKKLLRGEAASLINVATYTVLLFIGLVLALLWG